MIKTFQIVLALCFMWLTFPQNKTSPPVPPPSVSDADQTKIRKMQLDDARISNAIQQRQLEIVDLQRQRELNAEGYRKFVAGVCGKDFVFSQENDVLSCVEKPKEKK